MSKILIVDDDKDLAGVIRDALESLDFTVVHAANGVQARPQLASGSYDLIVMDWDLPDASGVDLCKELRGAGGTAPVIMLTGKQELEDKLTGLYSGADDYLTKPFAMKELIGRIRSLLRRTAMDASGDRQAVSIACGATIAGVYLLADPIGSGSFGQVWRATHIKTARPVVLKMLHAAVACDPENLKRFERECHAMSAISHPNVVSVIDVGSLANQQPYLVLEYVDGMPLRKYLRSRKQLDLDETLEILIQVCRGIQEAHNAGIVHRDLKPDNILLKQRSDHPDWVKITDFGIARLVYAQENITQDGSIVGTAEYIAPEQAQALTVDHRADIYAIGVILFELLTGQLPFRADTPLATVMQHVQAPVPQLSSLRRDLAPGSPLDQILAKAMSKDRENRFQSADQMRQSMEKALKELKSPWTSWCS